MQDALERLMALTGKICRNFLPYSWKAGLSHRFSQIRAWLLGPYATAVLTQTTNGRLLIPSSDFVIGRALAFRGTYDPEMVELLAARINERASILVVSAHVGSLLIPLAKIAKTAIAIEANPRTFEFLEMNLKLNDIRNVEAWNFAAGEVDGEVEFLANVHNTGQSKRRTRFALDNSCFTYDSPTTIQVPLRRLDGITNHDFDLILIDVEGSEAYAMAGMPQLLSRAKNVVIEICSDHYEDPQDAQDRLLPFLASFENAIIVEEEKSSRRIWRNSEFRDLIANVFRAGFANVLFWKCERGV